MVACIAVGPISVGDKTVLISDVFIPGAKAPLAGDEFEAIQKHVRKHRAVRWEDELTRLLDQAAEFVQRLQSHFIVGLTRRTTRFHPRLTKLSLITRQYALVGASHYLLK